MSYQLTQGWPKRSADGVFVNPEGDEYKRYIEGGGVSLPVDPDLIPSSASQIDALERQSMLSRASREFMLAVMEDKAIVAGATRVPPLTAAQSIQVLRAGNVGYSKVKTLDETIAALRLKP